MRAILILLLFLLAAACSTALPPVENTPQSEIIVPETPGALTPPAPGATLPSPQVASATPKEVTEEAAQSISTAQPGLETSAPAPGADFALPDLLFIRNGDLWLWVEGKSAQRLTTSGQVLDARRAPGGRSAAFIRQIDTFHTELWVVNLDGTDERRLVSVADLDLLNASPGDGSIAGIIPYQFAWVPGKQLLAFNTRRMFDGPGLVLQDDLHLVDTEGPSAQTLLPAGLGGMFYFSPDGEQIALVSPTSISLINTDGSNRRENILPYEAVLTYSEYSYYAQPVWSPDSSSLLVSLPPRDPLADPPMITEIWRVLADGLHAEKLNTFTAVPFFSAEVFISPDTQRLAYLAESGEPGQNLRDLHIAAPDGLTDIVHTTEPLLHFLSWSPDSQQFLYLQGDERQMVIGQAGEGSLPPGETWSSIVDARWLEGGRILYTRETSGLVELRLFTVEEGDRLLDTIQGPPPKLLP